MTEDGKPNETMITLASDIVAAYVGNNAVSSNDVAGLVASIYDALSGLGAASAAQEVERTPAVSIKSSVKPEYIVCLECGGKMKVLRRHLGTHHGLSVEEYRARWNLPVSYPLVAPKYSEKRTELAKQIGLGRKPKAPSPASASTPAGRKAKTTAEKPVAAESPAVAEAPEEKLEKPAKKGAGSRKRLGIAVG